MPATTLWQATRIHAGMSTVIVMRLQLITTDPNSRTQARFLVGNQRLINGIIVGTIPASG
jgi:hypothetical protein